MVQIYEDAPSFGQQMARGGGQATASALLAGGEEYLGRKRQRETNEQLRQLTGADMGKLPPELQKIALQESLRGQRKAFEMQSKKPDLSGAVRALDTLEGLISKKGIGWSSFNYGKEARHNRGEFKATQSAILPLFKSMFPRGMTEKEFNFVNEHYIPQENDTEATIRGKIKGLRQLVSQHSLETEESDAFGGEGERPPLSSFGG